MPLLSCLSRTWSHIQGYLFPWLTEELGPLTETHKQVVTALEVAGVEAFVQVWSGLPGRPPCDRSYTSPQHAAHQLWTDSFASGSKGSPFMTGPFVPVGTLNPIRAVM